MIPALEQRVDATVILFETVDTRAKRGVLLPHVGENVGVLGLMVAV
jgi:hypothetical protein